MLKPDIILSISEINHIPVIKKEFEFRSNISYYKLTIGVFPFKLKVKFGPVSKRKCELDVFPSTGLERKKLSYIMCDYVRSWCGC